jgi:hypothetical protein
MAFYAAEQQRICRKRSLTCLSEASFQTPGRFEQRRVVPQNAGPSNRLPFLWFVSLGKQRNEQNQVIYEVSAYLTKINDKSKITE